MKDRSADIRNEKINEGKIEAPNNSFLIQVAAPFWTVVRQGKKDCWGGNPGTSNPARKLRTQCGQGIIVKCADFAISCALSFDISR